MSWNPFRKTAERALSRLPAGVWVENQPGVYQKTLDALAGLGLIERRKAGIRWEYRKPPPLTAPPF